MNYLISIYERNKPEDGEQTILLKKSIYEYCKERGILFEFDKKNLSFTRKGKPYLENSPIHFNVSHSGKWLAIMVGEDPCGIDIQIYKKCKFMDISKRYFNRKEVTAIEKKVEREGIYQGEREFFRLWAEREAYGKFTGDGFFNQREIQREKISIHSLELKDHLYCAYCIEGTEKEVEFVKRIE